MLPLNAQSYVSKILLFNFLYIALGIQGKLDIQGEPVFTLNSQCYAQEIKKQNFATTWLDIQSEHILSIDT